MVCTEVLSGGIERVKRNWFNMSIPTTSTHEILHSFFRERQNVSLRYLEVGVREGDSLAVALSYFNVRLAVGIDNWGGGAGGTNRGNGDHVWKPVKKHPNVLLLSGNSLEVMSKLYGQFEVIYIDGDHSEQGCLDDLNACLRLLAPRGTILVDDLLHPLHTYLYPAVEAWAQAYNFTFIFHPGEVGVGELVS